jgi:Cof subfamily protein (haloacid dehalogenase superfamily)
MNIKLIATDFDGTLLRTDKTISDYTASVFRRCKNKGIKIVFATARPIRAVRDWLNLPVSFDAAIYHNGAVINVGDLNILRYGISPKTTKEILFSVLQADKLAKLGVEIDDRLYSNYNPSDIWLGIERTVTDFTDLPDVPADKIMLPMASRDELNAIAGALPDNLYIEISENTVGMIMNKNATKVKAVIYVAERFGLSVADIAAFGDDYNDIEMLRGCGVGIAVANAIDEVKSIAGYICDTNDNDGVARWIEERILL